MWTLLHAKMRGCILSTESGSTKKLCIIIDWRTIMLCNACYSTEICLFTWNVNVCLHGVWGLFFFIQFTALLRVDILAWVKKKELFPFTPVGSLPHWILLNMILVLELISVSHMFCSLDLMITLCSWLAKVYFE